MKEKNEREIIIKEKVELQFIKRLNNQKLKEKGITLIALVITIILLLILVGVTLVNALSENGLIKKAKDAVTEYKKSEIDEQNILGEIDKITDNIILDNEIEFIANPTSWTNESVELEIKAKDSKYEIEYSLDCQEWNEYKGKLKIDENKKIYARLKGKDVYVIKEIKNIDKEPPTINLEQIDLKTKEYNKVIRADIKDELSGIEIKKYEDREREKEYFNDNGKKFEDTSITVNTMNTTYSEGNSPSNIYTFYAKDKAGNETIKSIEVQNLLLKNNLYKPIMCVCVREETEIENGIVLESDKGIWGPYWYLRKGVYEITYTGENLDKGLVYSYSIPGFFEDNVQRNYEIKNIEKTNIKFVYRIELKEDSPGVEFQFLNPQSANCKIILKDIEIKQIS